MEKQAKAIFGWCIGPEATPTRRVSFLERLIPIDFTGSLQCDGYRAYDRFAHRREREGQL